MPTFPLATVKLPVPDNDKSYCLSILRQACVRYLRQMIELGRAYNWTKESKGNKNPSEENRERQLNITLGSVTITT